MKTYSAQALPYEFDFDLEHTALLIIDMPFHVFETNYFFLIFVISRLTLLNFL